MWLGDGSGNGNSSLVWTISAEVLCRVDMVVVLWYQSDVVCVVLKVVKINSFA